MKKERIEELRKMFTKSAYNRDYILECLDAIEDLKEQLLNMKLEAQHWKIVAAQLQKTKGKE